MGTYTFKQKYNLKQLILNSLIGDEIDRYGNIHRCSNMDTEILAKSRAAKYI